MSEPVPRWLVVLLVASAPIWLLGIGLLEVQEEGTWAALVPFVLLAALVLAVLLVVVAVRDPSSQLSTAPYRPRSGASHRLRVAVLLSFPLALVAAAVVSSVTGQWLAAGLLLTMAVTPLVLRVRALRSARSPRGQVSTGSP